MQSGAQCVMTPGTLKRLRLSADSWDMKQQVHDTYGVPLV
jgi:hypothetical protein